MVFPIIVEKEQSWLEAIERHIESQPILITQIGAFMFVLLLNTVSNLSAGMSINRQNGQLKVRQNRGQIKTKAKSHISRTRLAGRTPHTEQGI